MIYAMHENAPIKMIGYVMGYFANGAEPVFPWSLHLNFNHTHKSFKLLPEHFTSDGENVSKLLLQKIQSIDSKWMTKGGEPIFEEVSTKRQLKIQESTLEFIESAMNNKPREITFYRVMDEVFGRDRLKA